MKKLLAILAFIAFPAFADYTMIVPQKPGGGTSVWAQIIAAELEPYLGEKINIVHIPGANDVPGFNKFHNELRFNEKTIMVSHGGNGVSFLLDDVEYNYFDYDPIAMMNLTIVNGILKDFDPIGDKIKFAGGSGMFPDVFAHLLLKLGPDATIKEAKAIFDEMYIFVKGMSGGERRLAFKRGELNTTRENPAAYKKHVDTNENADVWFSHGIYNAETGEIDPDPNFPGLSFREVFVDEWGVEPTGELWEAYQLIRNFRDVMQKALWMNTGDEHTPIVREAMQKMLADPEAVARIEKKTGQYKWVVGSDMHDMVTRLLDSIEQEVIEDVVELSKHLGRNAKVKEELIQE